MMAMKIFRKRITYKTAAILLFIFLFFTGGTIYLILSARENKTTSRPTPTATQSTSAGESTSSAQPTVNSITDTASDTSKESSSNGDSTQELEEESASITLSPSGNTVTITASGFSPPTITISVGESVMWVNNDIKNHWPASDIHTKHTDYSGFDSLGISSGSSWSFKFNATGTWNYHDHNLPARKGIVIVQ